MERGIVREGDRVVAKGPLHCGVIPAGSTGVVRYVDGWDQVYVSWDGFAGRLRNYDGIVGIYDMSGWSVNSFHIELLEPDRPMEDFDVESLFQSV